MQPMVERATKPVRTFVVMAAFTAVLPLRLLAQAPLPAARYLLDRHLAMTNSRLLMQRGVVHTTGTFSMTSMGTTGDLEVIHAQPNRTLMRVTLPGLGEIRTGFDGQVGWSMNAMEGPRLMSGAELTQIRDEADFGSNVRDSSLFATMETVEKTEMGGVPCYKVRLAWKSGRETFDCYAVDSGLLVGSVVKTQTAMGAVDAVILFSDYRDFDGVKMPVTSTQQAFGQTMVMKVNRVTYEPVEASVFDLPAEIRALVHK